MSELLDNFRRFGEPIHSYMEVSHMKSVWGRVDPVIRSKSASVSIGIETLLVTVGVVESSYKTFQGVNKAFDTTRESIESSAAVLFQQSQYPVLKILNQNAEDLSDLQNQNLQKQKTSIFL